MRKFLLTGIFITISTLVFAGNPPLPFGIKVGGQPAKPVNTNFATVADPVANNAELEVDSNSATIIVNVFPCDDKGNPKGATKVIILQGTNKTTLDKTMDKSKLAAGTYLMNIMASGKTARVMFKIK